MPTRAWVRIPITVTAADMANSGSFSASSRVSPRQPSPAEILRSGQ